MKFFVSGLVNVETNLRVRSFPVTYYPIDYPFFGINTTISGVGYNIAKAARKLGNDVTFASLIGKDNEGKRISQALDGDGVDKGLVFEGLECTPVSVILYEPIENGRRQIYSDLKDIQEKTLDPERVKGAIYDSDICVLCNSNFNRKLLPLAKDAGKLIATDVHMLNNVKDDFNRDFMRYADILFLSDEDLPCSPRAFIKELKKEYSAKITVIGCGAHGALLYDRATDGITEISAVTVGEIVNTIGAGDAMFTAFNHYYLKGCSAVEALKRAQVFAALKIRHDGGALGFSTEAEVDEIYRNYEFECKTE